MSNLKREIKECLQELLNDCKQTKDVVVDSATSGNLKPFIGQYVLIRANLKGVQVGILKGTDDQFLYLQPSRKL